MNICLVSQSYPTLPTFGGIAVYTRNMAMALARRGHSVHVIATTTSSSSEDFEDGGIHVHIRKVRWLPLVGKWLPGLGESFCIAGILVSLHRRHHFDIVEIPNWEGMGLISTCVPGMRIVVRLHTSMAESVEMAERQPTRAERFMIWAEKTSTRRAKAVVTHSEAHRKRMAAVYGRSDIEMFPHGVHIPDQVTPPTGISVFAIGRMNARKGMETLLEAIPSILAAMPEASFRIVGTDENHPRVAQFRRDYPGRDRVEFLGAVTEEKVMQLYDECAVYVSPAIYESFGLTFIEAMARGRPVVGCAASAVPEIVRDGVDGLLVPPRDPSRLGDAILTLLRDDAMRRRMGDSGRERALDCYAIETAAARAETYFGALCAGESRPGP